MQLEKTWKYETIGSEGNTVVFGINPFEYKWDYAEKRGKIRESSGKVSSYAVSSY